MAIFKNKPKHKTERDGHAEDRRHRHDDLPHPVHEDESNWLVSYADMMTLLCGFFIMLFSMSKMDAPAYESVKKEVVEHFGGKYEAPVSEQRAEKMAKFMTQVLKEAGIEKEASVKYDMNGTTVVFHSTVFFDTLSAEVGPKGVELLGKLIQGVHDLEEKDHQLYRVVVEGHTDSRPILGGNFPSNWELSSARASRVVRHFLDRGFQPSQMTPIGYADTRPELPSRTPAGAWDEAALSKNRRVVLRILDPSVNSLPLTESALIEAKAEDAATQGPEAGMSVSSVPFGPPERSPASASPPTQAPSPTPSSSATPQAQSAH